MHSVNSPMLIPPLSYDFRRADYFEIFIKVPSSILTEAARRVDGLVLYPYFCEAFRRSLCDWAKYGGTNGASPTVSRAMRRWRWNDSDGAGQPAVQTTNRLITC